MTKKYEFKKLEMLSLEKSKDTKETESLLKESMTVVSEVRNELAQAYKDNKEFQSSIEQLNSNVKVEGEKCKDYEKTIESLKSELDIFKVRDVEVAKATYNKRLEQLSKDFGALGQVKTVETLSRLSKDVIGEFESITKLALKTKNEEQLSIVTIPTQTIPSKQTPQKRTERLDGKDFFAGLGNTLSKQQNADGSDNKRIITL